MIRRSFRGVIRGRTIELEIEPDIPDGKEVDVFVNAHEAPELAPVDAEQSQDANEIDWDAWDAIMEEFQRGRKIERRSSSDDE